MADGITDIPELFEAEKRFIHIMWDNELKVEDEDEFLNAAHNFSDGATPPVPVSDPSPSPQVTSQKNATPPAGTELYNSTLSSYKDYSKKADAWRSVSLQSELPEEDCRRKWKSLRDQFIKEQRRSAMGNSSRKWKFTDQMAFLTPFIQTRTSMSNYVVEGEDGDGDKEMNNNSGHGSHKMRDALRDAETPPHFPIWAGHKRWELNGHEGNEDEMFLLSLLPHLKKLPYEKKCAVKLKFHQLLYEAEFQ